MRKMAGKNTGIIMMGMVMLLGVGGVALYMWKKKEGGGSEELPPQQQEYQYQPGEAGNVYNIGYGGPGFPGDWFGGPRYNHWRDYGRSLYGVWFRDDDIEDFFRWLDKKHRDDDDVEDWIRKRMKKNRKNRRGDRGNRDRDDDDKEWWKRVVDWDRDHDRDRDRDRNWSPTDRLLDPPDRYRF